MKKILFLCTGNSARSQLAEALFNHMADENFSAVSAGLEPSVVDPRVFTVLEQYGVDGSYLKSQSVEEFDREDFDVVITLCEHAKDECVVFDNSGAQIHWDFPDPKDQEGVAVFDEVYKGLKERISLFLLLHGQEAGSAVVPTMLFKVMSDPLRLKIMMLLEDEEVLSVTDLTDATGESQPKVSRHLALLRDSGFLQDERDGLWIFYRLSTHLPTWIKHTLQTVRNGNPAIINEEKKKLKAADRKKRYVKKG
ncbi:metalloregulator ArsR/SmtB family transcription factor [Vibrio sp. JC009]|uniref:metalloregulator ArsR/SmtB family transcription factor n=1 Tax=Vibrio sp. JC009 TaxID=2912314 RepID=UPI0023AFC7E8|nr:metalloregulator ArsR/SmtB family transcription factor [Vibrio sp. JC009]WED22718.1 metalloregulator ArsR/SmtB family transcription factor [Vibrio sp. JC009]